jgi:hypothetical protein
MEVSGQLHAPAALPAGKELLLAIVYEAGKPQSLSGGCGEEKNPFPCRK